MAQNNNSKYIDRCLGSIIKQDYDNIEILFIDDFSTDDSLKIANKFKKKIRIITKTTPKRIAASRNQAENIYTCFRKSRGKIIFLIDSDDYFKEKKISCVVNEFKKKKANIIFDLPTLKSQSLDKNKKFSNSLLKNYWSYIPPTSCIAIKREAFLKIYEYIYFEKYPSIWLDFRIGIISKYILEEYNIINKNLTYYWQSQNNISSKNRYLTINWWKRRMEAHEFVRYLLTKNKIKYEKNFDYLITKIINLLI